MSASTVTMPEATVIRQMYESGHGTPAIAVTVGRSRKAVRTALRQLGVELRSRSQAQYARQAARRSPH
jgi:hypothetical protein